MDSLAGWPIWMDSLCATAGLNVDVSVQDHDLAVGQTLDELFPRVDATGVLGEGPHEAKLGAGQLDEVAVDFDLMAFAIENDAVRLDTRLCVYFGFR